MDNNLDIKTNITEAATQSVTEKEPEKAQEPEKAPKLPPHREYAKRIVKFRKFYIQLLATIGVAMIGALLVALFYNLAIGVAVAAVATLLYRYFAVDEMFKQLGLKYTSIVGGIKITGCEERYGDVLWIPESIIFFDVTEISDEAFTKKEDATLRCVFIPKTVTRIGKNIFANIPTVTEIRYEGTKEEWEMIENETDLASITLFFEAKYPPIPKKKKKKKANKTK